MTDSRTERFVAQLPSLLKELERRATALFQFQLTPESGTLPLLEEIADFLWRMGNTFDQQDRRINILLVGTYLGEIVRQEKGGRWRVEKQTDLPVVDLPDNQVFDPMTLVQQKLELGKPALTEAVLHG